MAWGSAGDVVISVRDGGGGRWGVYSARPLRGEPPRERAAPAWLRPRASCCMSHRLDCLAAGDRTLLMEGWCGAARRRTTSRACSGSAWRRAARRSSRRSTVAATRGKSTASTSASPVGLLRQMHMSAHHARSCRAKVSCTRARITPDRVIRTARGELDLAAGRGQVRAARPRPGMPVRLGHQQLSAVESSVHLPVHCLLPLLLSIANAPGCLKVTRRRRLGTTEAQVWQGTENRVALRRGLATVSLTVDGALSPPGASCRLRIVVGEGWRKVYGRRRWI
jgi:hypothetical protein